MPPAAPSSPHLDLDSLDLASFDPRGAIGPDLAAVCAMEDPRRTEATTGEADPGPGLRRRGSDSRWPGPSFRWPGPGFRWTVFQRHGRRPLAVLSRALLQADNRCAGLASWSEIAIHETAEARFAACVRHAPPPASGPSWRDAWLCDTVEDVRAAFDAHDPLAAVPPDAFAPTTFMSTTFMPGAFKPGAFARRGDVLGGAGRVQPGDRAADAMPIVPMIVASDWLSGDWLSGDGLAGAWRFRAAWSGLLGAVFGLPGIRGARHE